MEVGQPQWIVLSGSAVRDPLGPGSDLNLLVIVQETAEEIMLNLSGIPLPEEMVATELDARRYGSPLTEEQAARLREALLTETEDHRPDLLRLLDRPDALSMIEVLVC